PFIRVPASAVPGRHWISGVGRQSGFSAQKSFVVKTNWVTQGFSNAHRGLNPFENVLSPANVGGLQERWTGQLNASQIMTSPAVVGSNVFIGGGDALYAFGRNSHQLLWKGFVGPGEQPGPAAVAGRIVYTGTLNLSGDGFLYAFSADGCGQAECGPLWSVPIGAGRAVS